MPTEERIEQDKLEINWYGSDYASCKIIPKCYA